MEELRHHIVFENSPGQEHFQTRVLNLLNAILGQGSQIMSAVSDFVAKQKAHNDKTGAAIDSLVTSVGGVTADIAALNDKITALQNSQGQITPEDQAALDEIEAAGNALADKADGVAAALAALDAANPPPPPPVA